MSQKLLARFNSQAESAQRELDKFAVEFAQDPAHALSWSNGVFAKAAKLRVLKQVIGSLQETQNIETDDVNFVKSCMMDRVLHKSKYPAQSTSPTINLIEQYELAACAEILSDLEYF